MNSAVVTKVEVRLLSAENFVDLDIIPYSGTIKEKWSKSFAGTSALVSVDFKKEKWSLANGSTFKPMLNARCQFKVTDSNGVVYLVGTRDIPARLLYESSIEKNPGSFNGYSLSIDWKTPDGCMVTE